MENPFSVAVTAATVEVIVDTKEQVSYQTTKMQRDHIDQAERKRLPYYEAATSAD